MGGLILYGFFVFAHLIMVLHIVGSYLLVF
ncbi:UNVERIFIED_ORG: hypothetical protein BDK47_13130 [Anoxybacillus amylolyticus]